MISSIVQPWSGAFRFFSPAAQVFRQVVCLSLLLVGVAVALASLQEAEAAEVAVLAGAAAGRAADSPAADMLNEPFAIDFDAEGRLYGVEFTRGNRVFRSSEPITPEGGPPTIDFVAGVFHQTTSKIVLPVALADAPAAAVRFNGMHDLAIAPDGRIYLADTFNHVVRIFDPVSGRVATLAGTGERGFAGDGGAGREARLKGPKYVCMDREQRVLIVDTENHCVRCYDPASGQIELVAGVPRQAGAAIGDTWKATELHRPHGARIAPDGRLVIADSENDRVLIGAY